MATKTSTPQSSDSSKSTAKSSKARATKAAHASSAAVLIHGQPAYAESAGEAYMNAAQKTHFRAILEAWKRELMEEVDRTLHYMQDESANLPDPVDRASQEEEFSLELRTRDRERKLIRKIDETLKSLDEDDYGYCATCGEKIGIRRLEARPTATLCIDCKTLAEIKEKQLQG